MKTFKRVLAMSLALALLLSFSPALGVSAADADNTAYNQLMHNYKVAASDDFSDESNTLASITDTMANGTDTIFREEDATGNTYIKYCDTASSGNYAYLTHGLGTLDIIVFEADVRWENPGLGVTVSIRNKGSGLMTIADGAINFLYPGGGKLTAPLEQGLWHKITYVINAKTGKFEAFVNEEYVGSKNLPSNVTASTRIGVRFTVTSATDSQTEDFFIDNVKWYTPDSTGACTDANKDHICDYDVNCAQIGEHVNNNGVCDYCGESFASESKEYIVVDGAIVDEKGDVVANNEITASGVLNMNGENATVKVAEGATLAVLDTSWMTNGLSGEKAAKLTVDPESKGTVESYTQYGDFKYLKVPGENGTYTFHPFNLTITRMGLNTVKEAISLEVQFIADDVVRNLLIGENEEHAYGLKNLKTGEYKSVKENSAYQFTAQNNRAVAYFALSGSLLNENFDAEGKFQAYMKLNIGGEEVEILSNYIADITPREVMTALNNSDVAASDSQLAKIQAIWTNEDGTEKADYSELKSVLTRFH